MDGWRLGEFATVDRASDPAVLVEYLDSVEALPRIRMARADLLEALALQTGQVVLDVACGTGTESLQMARNVEPGGRVVGIDVSEIMLAQARGRIAGSRLPVAFRRADVYELPFDDNQFDACRAERLLQHLAEPDRAVAEMLRVTRPGGRVGLLEMDLGTVFVDSPDPATTRAVIDAFGESMVQPWAGRQLGRLLRGRGLVDVRVTPHAVLTSSAFAVAAFGPQVKRLQEEGLVGEAVAARWLAQVAAVGELGPTMCGAMAFVAVGIKTADETTTWDEARTGRSRSLPREGEASRG